MTTHEAKQEVSSTQTITPEQLKKWLSSDNPNGFTQYEVWLKTQTDPLATLDALKIACNFKLISLPQLAKAIASIGLHPKKHEFLQSAPDLTGKQFTSWKDWLAWMERTLTTTFEFPHPCAHQLLKGLAALTENYYVIRPFKADAINNLLARLNTCRSLEEIRDGLKDLRVLVDYQGVQNIAGLHINTLHDLLNHTPPQNKDKEEKDAKTNSSVKKIPEIVIRTQIANHIAYLITQISTASSHPQPIQPASLELEKALDRALKFPDTPAGSFSLLLLAVGKILQAEELSGKNKKLKEKVTQILAFLNKESTAANMSISHLAAAVYALVLPAPPNWCDLGSTNNLVEHFFKRLLTEEASPADLQPMAEFLCLTHQTPLPEPIIDHLKNNRPLIDEDSLQHQFGLYLQDQSWFKERYEIVGEEVLLDNSYAYLDFIIRDKQTGELINVEVDGWHHQNHPPDKRRDIHLRSLIDPKTNKPVLKGICRLRVPRKLKGFYTREQVLPLMANDLQYQLKALGNTLSKPSTLSSVLTDSKSSGFETKKPHPLELDTTEKPSNTQPKRKKWKKKKLKKPSLQDLIADIESA